MGYDIADWNCAKFLLSSVDHADNGYELIMISLTDEVNELDNNWLKGTCLLNLLPLINILHILLIALKKFDIKCERLLSRQVWLSSAPNEQCEPFTPSLPGTTLHTKVSYFSISQVLYALALF